VYKFQLRETDALLLFHLYPYMYSVEETTYAILLLPFLAPSQLSCQPGQASSTDMYLRNGEEKKEVRKEEIPSG
jgi:hypothetical protein